jgi:hypothetical protein
MDENGLQTLYEILRGIARDRSTRSYTQLSELYRDRSANNVWIEPHGGWDWPLDAVNKRLEAAKLPPLSAVIVDQQKGEPGRGFWNTVAWTRQVAPRNAEERVQEHAAILNEVYAAPWPAALPAG